jgi:hypothetical protein
MEPIVRYCRPGLSTENLQRVKPTRGMRSELSRYHITRPLSSTELKNFCLNIVGIGQLSSRTNIFHDDTR